MASTLDNARHLLSLDDGEDSLIHMFAICAVLTHLGEDVPHEWQYRPSPLGVEGELASWPDSEWLEMAKSGDITPDDMRTIGNELTTPTNP